MKKIALSVLLLVTTIFLFNDIHPIDALTQTNNFNNGSSTGWNGNVYTERFTGLPVGGSVTQLSLNVSAVAGHVRAKIYDENGFVATHTQTNSHTGSEIVSGGNGLVVEKMNGLPVGGKISGLEEMTYTGSLVNGRAKIFDNTGTLQFINNTSRGGSSSSITSGGGGEYMEKFTGLNPNTVLTGVVAGGSSVFNTNCCYQMFAYTDNAGSPGTLIGFSPPFKPSSVDAKYGQMRVMIPASGTIWAGFVGNWSTHYVGLPYTDAAGLQNCNGAINSLPTTANGCSDIGLLALINIYWNGKNSTFAGNLLGESPPTTVSGGSHVYAKIPVNATIPNDGTVWVGSEFPSTVNLEFAAVSGIMYGVQHTYGAGPSNAGPETSLSDPIEAYSFRLDYSAISGAGTLLGESNSILVNSTGQQNFPLISNAKIQSSGNVWGAFETDNTGLGLRELTKALTGNIYNYTHGYGSGPNPISGDSNSTHPVWMQITYVNPTYTVSLKPLLHDGVTPITSGKLVVTQNGVTIGTGNTNSSGYASVNVVGSGNYNFTVFDDKNFEVYKEYNTNVASNIVKSITTYDTPFNCISATIGYQSDLILRINDTDGTRITNITTPTCKNNNIVNFNMTFTGNGQSGNIYSSSMITTAATTTYEANPSSFTVNGTIVPTTFSAGNNIISNSFTIGSGLVTNTKQFIITLTTTQSTGSASQSGGQNYFTTNTSCFAGVYDPKSQSCVFGPAQITITPTTITTNANQQNTTTIIIQCTGTNSLTINSIDFGSNPIGLQANQLPQTVNCNPNPTVCPSGSTLQNGVCVAPLTCPLNSMTQNGMCVAPVTCPAGTTQQGTQCIAQPTCSDGTQPVNGQCQTGGIPITQPPTPPNCSLLNPLSCILPTQSTEPVVIAGVTANGQTVSVSTNVTSVQNPQLNNVSLVIIILIIAAIVAGVIYRYITRKPKYKTRSRHGKDKTIKEFNKNVRKK